MMDPPPTHQPAAYISHSKNELGRDFIVADLHGCYSALMYALEKVDFNYERDRVFSVGDLADRGPESYECLHLLTQSWFYAVLGNHEAMLLQFLNLRDSTELTRTDFFMNGGRWYAGLNEEQKDRVMKLARDYVLNLPMVRTIDHGRRPFDIVHAQLWVDGQFLNLDRDLRHSWSEGVCTWERSLIFSQLRNLESGHSIEHPCPVGINAKLISPVLSEQRPLTYVGHTILSKPILTQSHFFIDCGSYMQRERAIRRRLDNSEKDVVTLYEHDAVCDWIEKMEIL